MQFSARCLAELDGPFRVLKAPACSGPPAQRDPAVIATRDRDARRRSKPAASTRCCATPPSSTTGPAPRSSSTAPRSPPAATRSIRRCARPSSSAPSARRSSPPRQRNQLSDFETELAPGVRAGHRYVPVQRVGAYLPAGRFPILASAFMTVGVAKAAGVPTVLACTPPQPDGRPDPAVLYAAYLSGADRVYVLGGVQALAAMAFGLLGERAGRHARRGRQRLRRRGQAPALRQGVDRPAGRAVRGRRHRRRDRRPGDRRRRPARPGRARSRLAGRAGHHVRGVRAAP